MARITIIDVFYHATPAVSLDADKGDQHWITTEGGSHILLNGEGEVIGGAGGKLDGRKLGARTESEKPQAERLLDKANAEHRAAAAAYESHQATPVPSKGKKEHVAKGEALRQELQQKAGAKYEAMSAAGYNPFTGKKERDSEKVTASMREYAKANFTPEQLKYDNATKEALSAFMAGANGEPPPEVRVAANEHSQQKLYDAVHAAYEAGKKADPEGGRHGSKASVTEPHALTEWRKKREASEKDAADMKRRVAELTAEKAKKGNKSKPVAEKPDDAWGASNDLKNGEGSYHEKVSKLLALKSDYRWEPHEHEDIDSNIKSLWEEEAPVNTPNPLTGKAAEPPKAPMPKIPETLTESHKLSLKVAANEWSLKDKLDYLEMTANQEKKSNPAGAQFAKELGAHLEDGGVVSGRGVK